MINFSKKNNHSGLPYRPAVGMIIINKENKIFVGKRIDSKIEAWQMPQGGIDVGETPSAAAMREMREEIGTNKAYILAESKFWYSYDLPRPLISKLWHGKYRGQKQKWFLIRFTGEDHEININTIKPEFCGWCWIEFNQLLDVIILFKKPLYQAVINEFKIILEREKVIIN